MRSLLGVPVRTGGEPIGNFYLTDKEGADEFGEQDQRLVEMFALHAGIAIQNARLHARVQQLAVIDERIRIGRDLHDGIIQGIYAVALSLEDVPELMAEDAGEASSRVDVAIDRLNTTIGEIRTFIVGLGSDIVQAAIGSRLAGLADEMLLSFGAQMALDLDLADVGEVDARLSQEAATQLLQIAREALSNAIRHSGAPRARLSLRAQDDQAVLSVEDNGRGFDTSLPRRPGHFGLANLRDRAASVGGTIEISSRIGAGTRIIVRLPLVEPGDRYTVTDTSPARPLRLLVVDDHEVVRQGLVALLDRREGFQVVAEAGTVAEAIEQTLRFQPDIVVMDVRLPDGSGIEACREIRSELPGDPGRDADLVPGRGGGPLRDRRRRVRLSPQADPRPRPRRRPRVRRPRRVAPRPGRHREGPRARPADRHRHLHGRARPADGAGAEDPRCSWPRARRTRRSPRRSSCRTRR